ncbi:MAG: helix-turn-helix domain-containing protein [Paracoccaceae bacterium]
MRAYRHLSRDDTDQIAGMLAAGLTQGQMAEAIDKSKSKISRELRAQCAEQHGLLGCNGRR